MSRPAVEPKSELDATIDRLRRAAQQLESAAMDVDDAIAEIKDDDNEATRATGDLAREVQRLHDDQHEGLIRYCTDACRMAWEQL